ncbi:hypothetical protein QE152_g10856 [Popillia japonica]|uniref:Uncharacterized protein n=1 Tax=Popillia japonica TaxID=7064 RepID=A0AAW1LU82_POPJA
MERLYTPDQWISMERLEKRKQPYEVYQLSQNDVYDLKDLQNSIAINFDKDRNGEKVQISNVRIIATDPEFPNCLLFKTTYEQDPEFPNCLLFKTTYEQEEL